jgi:hypothetical protein
MAGYFQHGKRHGEGIFTYPNKDVYSGMWKHGKKSGQGVYVYNATGIKLMGEWSEGLIKRGRWILPNGVYYEGEFENNKPTKSGKPNLLRPHLFFSKNRNMVLQKLQRYRR